MSDAPGLAAMEHHAPLTLVEKTRVWAACLLAAYIFLTVGWAGMEPDDPHGPVSLLTRHSALMMTFQGGALAAVTAALATVLAGRQLVDIGTFSACIGLGVVSLRGGTMETLLLLHGDAPDSSYRGLAMLLSVEAVCWFAVVLLCIIVSGLTARWCFGADSTAATPSADSPHAHRQAMSAFDAWGWFPPGSNAAAASRTPVADGLRHALIVTGLGFITFAILAAESSDRAIRHGQACFVTAASVCIACYVAHRMFPVRSALWSVLAVGAIAVAGYLWSAVSPDRSTLPNVPPTGFLRVLPIQFVSVGVAAAVAMLWYTHIPHATQGAADNAAPGNR